MAIRNLSIDTVILGRKTYDWIMAVVDEFPHMDKISYIITRTERPSIGNINFYNGTLNSLVKKLKSEKGKNIFIDGGAEIVHELLKANLIDEFIISIIPILVGDGIKLFADGRPELKLKLVTLKKFETGLIQMHYERVDND